MVKQLMIDELKTKYTRGSLYGKMDRDYLTLRECQNFEFAIFLKFASI